MNPSKILTMSDMRVTYELKQVQNAMGTVKNFPGQQII